ncbi:hypothetical protein ACIQUQ_34420 [Streptomyces sp. NPDC101118]|uniref:hypothetical protein n=1 Tax=Streptomyces sp. NPDC101118 TaxID=3366109 RepID=UPI0037F3F3DF
MKLSPAVILAASLAGVVTMGGVAVAVDGRAGETVAQAAAELPPSAVEDFAYPQADADAALKARGIKLKSGDGHIMYAACTAVDDPSRIEVYSHTEPNKPFCFRVTGAAGSLVLELPRVYAVRAGDYKVHVDMTVEKSEVSFDVPKNEWVGVGKTTDPQKRDHALVALTASK